MIESNYLDQIDKLKISDLKEKNGFPSPNQNYKKTGKAFEDLTGSPVHNGNCQNIPATTQLVKGKSDEESKALRFNLEKVAEHMHSNRRVTLPMRKAKTFMMECQNHNDETVEHPGFDIDNQIELGDEASPSND